MFFESFIEISVTAKALAIIEPTCLLLIYVGLGLIIVVFSLLREAEPVSLGRSKREHSYAIIDGLSLLCTTVPGSLQNLSIPTRETQEGSAKRVKAHLREERRRRSPRVHDARRKANRFLSFRRKSLPSPCSWPERPLYVRFVQPESNEAHRCNYPKGHLSLNPSIHDAPGAHSFETPFFKGKVVLRVAGVASSGSTPYFHGRKRLMDTVVQGRFKHRTCVGDVLTGQFFDLPWSQLPPRWVVSAIFRIVRLLDPSTKININGRHPFIVSPLVSACQTIHVAEPDNPNSSVMTPPDIIRDQSIAEETTLLGGVFSSSVVSAQKRKQIFNEPSTLRKLYFEPNYVYTFDFYQHLFALSTYEFKIGVGHVPLVKYMNGQPIEINAFIDPGLYLNNGETTPPNSDIDRISSYLWRIEAWHEALLSPRKNCKS